MNWVDSSLILPHSSKCLTRNSKFFKILSEFSCILKNSQRGVPNFLKYLTWSAKFSNCSKRNCKFFKTASNDALHSWSLTMQCQWIIATHAAKNYAWFCVAGEGEIYGFDILWKNWAISAFISSGFSFSVKWVYFSHDEDNGMHYFLSSSFWMH